MFISSSGRLGGIVHPLLVILRLLELDHYCGRSTKLAAQLVARPGYEGLLYGLGANAETILSKISKSDAELFRASVESVRPLKPNDRYIRKAAPEPPHVVGRNGAEVDPAYPARSQSNPGIYVADEDGQPLSFLRNGYPRKMLRQLGRGNFPIEDSFDLHGMREAPARNALLQFINESLEQGLRCVRIVHGKGLRSQGLPVLKFMSWELLKTHPGVLALTPGTPADGGSGTTLALLQANDRGKF